jgi:methoxymalonate biosynthesis acyl carrier protein
VPFGTRASDSFEELQPLTTEDFIMATEQASEKTPATPDAIERALVSFLSERTKASIEPDQDFFASGLVSSMFAMELVVYLEQSFNVSIVGMDLRLDNFRTVRAMTTLVLRLQEASETSAGA